MTLIHLMYVFDSMNRNNLYDRVQIAYVSLMCHIHCQLIKCGFLEK